MIVIVKSTK